jgi:DNA-binding transcriptional regulator YiaG
MTMQHNSTFTAHKLRTARNFLGLSQFRLAVALGVSEQAVSSWERGRRPIPGWLPVALRGLNVPVEEVEE